MNKITDTDDKVEENISATDKMGSLLPRPPAAPSSPLPLVPSDLGTGIPSLCPTECTHASHTASNHSRQLRSSPGQPRLSPLGVRSEASSDSVSPSSPWLLHVGWFSANGGQHPLHSPAVCCTPELLPGAVGKRLSRVPREK